MADYELTQFDIIRKRDEHGSSQPAYSEQALDRKIEDRDYRDANIPNKDSGILSLSIVPGDRYLGHLIIGPQFEVRYDGGDPARFNDCQTAQTEYLLESLDCMREFLEQVSGDDVKWNLSIAAHPYGGAADPDIPLIKSLVQKEESLEKAIEQVRQSHHEVIVPPQTIPAVQVVNLHRKIEAERQS